MSKNLNRAKEQRLELHFQKPETTLLIKNRKVKKSTFLFLHWFILYFCTVFRKGKVDRLKNYGIPFKGLKEGKHLFNYDIGAGFFELFEQPLIEKGALKAIIELNKSSALLTLSFKIEGEVETVCDNCLEALTLPVENESLMYIKFGEEYDEPTEEIIVLPHEENEINVAQLIYEFICVALPIRHVHPEDENGSVTCNTEMLNQLNNYLVEEGTDEEQDDDMDPRWAALKNLMDNK